MKDGMFVIDAHTGYWDASPENCRNKYGEAFVETFYAFHTGFNPASEPRWTMDYENTFRKVDPDWYLAKIGVHETGEIMGVKQLMELIQDEFPDLKYGYFNPPIERIKGNFEMDFAHY